MKYVILDCSGRQNVNGVWFDSMSKAKQFLRERFGMKRVFLSDEFFTDNRTATGMARIATESLKVAKESTGEHETWIVRVEK